MRTIRGKSTTPPRRSWKARGRIKAQAEAAATTPGGGGLREAHRRALRSRRRQDREMDAAGIDVQVLSLTSPGVEQLDATEAVALAREANDLLAEAVRRHPNRFAAFAALPTAARKRRPMSWSARSANTASRGLINGHTRGRYLRRRFFWPILERAEALQVPIYLHPRRPAAGDRGGLQGELRAEVAFGLATAAWGWHMDTATHVLRLVLGGVFDRYPSLQLVIGHMGEASVHAAQARDRLPIGGDEAGSPDRRLPPREPPLHFRRLQLDPRRSSTCCCRSASTGSCSRPTTPTRRWRRRAPSLTSSR